MLLSSCILSVMSTHHGYGKHVWDVRPEEIPQVYKVRKTPPPVTSNIPSILTLRFSHTVGYREMRHLQPGHVCNPNVGSLLLPARLRLPHVPQTRLRDDGPDNCQHDRLHLRRGITLRAARIQLG